MHWHAVSNGASSQPAHLVVLQVEVAAQEVEVTKEAVGGAASREGAVTPGLVEETGPEAVVVMVRAG